MFKSYFLLGPLLFFLSISQAQVNLPTGMAEFNFPLYSYSDNKLAVSVSLNYTGGGGIKVDELASDVGLGWALQYGGVISRIAVGDPDDQVGQDVPGFDADKLASGYLKHSYAFQCMERTGWVPMFAMPSQYFKHDPETIADRQQDIFTFQFNGESGSFVIGTDGTITPLQNTKLKIEKFEEDMSASQIVTTISKFVITTTSGLQYVFSDKDLSKIISYETAPLVQFFLDPPIANKSYFLAKTQYRVNNLYAVNNWHLSEIINPQTGKKITFNYDTYALEYVAGEDAVQSVEKVDDTNYKEVVQWIQKRFNGIVKRVTAIQLPNNTSVEFKYFATDRVDLPGGKALKEIVIKENGIEKSGYAFTYQYFSKINIRDFNYSFPVDEAPNARLSLLSIQRRGSNNYMDKPYTFSYYINDLSGITGWVPPRMTPAKDHFGYYNATTTYPYDNDLNIYKNLRNLFSPTYRKVFRVETIQNGALKTIHYPTGGSLTYEYELNTARYNNADVNAGGIRVRKVTQLDAVDNSKPIVNEYKYVDEDGHSSGWGYEEPVYADKTNTCTVFPTSDDYYTARLVYNIGSNMLSDALKGLIEKDEIKTGAVYAGASLQAVLIVAVVTTLASKIFSSAPKIEYKTNDNSYSAHPKNQNRLPFLYRRVEVYTGAQSDNIGKIVYDFTSDEDFPLIIPNYDIPYSSRLRYFSGAYGLIKRYKVFNKLNEPVKEVYNKYAVFTTELNTDYNKSVKCRPIRTLLCPVDYFSANSNQITLAAESYYPVTGRVELEYTTEKNYSGGNYMMKKTDYSYDPLYYNLKRTTTVNSLGEIIEARIYYPYDYSIPGVLSQMVDKNILDVPVSTETWLLKSGMEDRLLDAQVLDFQQTANGDYNPIRSYTLNATTPINKSIIGEFDPTKLNRNETFLKLERTLTYNDNGDINQTMTYGKVESNIYDDNSEGLIAKAVNATLSNIAYSSFEEKAAGNWQMAAGSVTLITDDATAPTGKRCLKLATASTLTKAGLDLTKEYFISFWYKGGVISISGATITGNVTGQTVNGWTFKTMRIKPTGTISVTGTAYIDELRLYPTDAKMITQCYNELMKVSSETAADNTTVYYEYDDLGRLKITRDAQRNIVGLHEYKDHQ